MIAVNILMEEINLNNSNNSLNSAQFGIKNTPYLTSSDIPKQYPWLSDNQYCDVCVVGGGLTAALCTLKIVEKGRSVVLITDREIGFGEDACISTAAEADCGFTLTELSRHLDTDTSIRLYSLGCEAMDELENLCNSLDAAEGKCGFKCEFQRRDSLIYTDDDSELELLNHEYLARKHNNFECTYITREMARDSFSFDISGGILSKAFAATFNPYHLTHLCLMRAEQMGVKIFEHTEAIDIETPKIDDGSVIITTSAHRKIYADRLVLATGSHGLETIFPTFRRRTRYYAISKPIPPEDESGWPGKCIIRTFGTPKIHYAFTPDGRISASGLENRTFGLGGRVKELLQMPNSSEKKFDHLEESIEYLFPAIPNIKTEFEYELQYSTAPDGLPVIGTHPEYRNCIFALCTGHGVPIYSRLAAQFAADMTEDLYNDDMDFFRLQRNF